MLTTERERKAMIVRYGLCVKEKCDRCGRLLQQSFAYRPIGVTDSAGGREPERVVYCSLECQERAYYGEKYESVKAKRHPPALPSRKCVECGGLISQFKKGDSEFCSRRCAKKNWRKSPGNSKVTENQSVNH